MITKKSIQRKDPGDLNHRDLYLLQRTKLDSLPKDYAFTSISPSYSLPTKRPFLNLPELSVISLQLIDLLQLSITPCNSCFHSPNVYANRFRSASYLPLRPWYSQLDRQIGYSFCTNRCNIRRGIGSFLSMVTSHLLAVPIPNQLIVTTCGLHVYDTFNHSLVTPLASNLRLRINLRLLSPASSLRLRHKLFTTLVLPCACSIFASGGLPRMWKLSLPYSLELA